MTLSSNSRDDSYRLNSSGNINNHFGNEENLSTLNSARPSLLQKNGIRESLDVYERSAFKGEARADKSLLSAKS